MYKVVSTISVIFVIFVKSSRACNGYSAKVDSFKNCVDDGVIQFGKNFNLVLDKDCNVFLKGCVQVTKPFKTAKGTYHLKKSPLPALEGELDMCKIGTSEDVPPEVIKVSDTLGIPKQCPVSNMKVCGSQNKKLSLSKYKNQLALGAGTSQIKLEIEHDVGKSCLEMQLTLSKGNKG